VAPQKTNALFGRTVISKEDTLTVPTSSVDRYKNADQWKDFSIKGGGILLSTAVNNGLLGSVTGHASGLYPNSASVTLTATPNNGCRFIKWQYIPLSDNNWYNSDPYPKKDYGATATISFNLTQDTMLTANFEVIPYHIIYEMNGGVNDSLNPATYTVRDKITLKKPTRPGYTFTRWRNMDSNTVTVIGKGSTGSMALWAEWKVNEYTIRFDAQGGGTVSRDSQPVTYGTRIDSLPVTNHSGYTFKGWFTAATGGTQYTDTTVYRTADDMTLYASWLPEGQTIYTVTFVSNDDSPADTQRVAHGDTVKRPADPTRDYYSFGGWYEEDTAFYYLWNFERKVYESCTVYAKWIPFDIEKAKVVINGKVLPPTDDVITYEVPCGDTATLRISLDTIPADTALIPVNRPYPSDTAITLKSLGGQTKEYTLRVKKPFVFSDIVVVQLGGKLLMTIANPEYNGGFNIQAAQWWKRGGVIVGSKLYYVLSGETASDSLYAKLQDATGGWLSTCPYVPAVITSAKGGAAREAVYPNPVAAGSTVHLKENVLIGGELQGLGELEERYATFLLFDVQGRLVREGKTSELHQGLTMPATPGIYHILLDGKAGKLQLKVAVGQ
jgi:uncharacterized repeat protein (TIGR02543 family)